LEEMQVTKRERAGTQRSISPVGCVPYLAWHSAFSTEQGLAHSSQELSLFQRKLKQAKFTVDSLFRNKQFRIEPEMETNASINNRLASVININPNSHIHMPFTVHFFEYIKNVTYGPAGQGLYCQPDGNFPGFGAYHPRSNRKIGLPYLLNYLPRRVEAASRHEKLGCNIPNFLCLNFPNNHRGFEITA